MSLPVTLELPSQLMIRGRPTVGEQIKWINRTDQSKIRTTTS